MERTEQHPSRASDQARASAEAMAERYGTRRPVARVVTLALVVVLAGAFLGWLAWTAWFHSSQPIAAEVASFDVQGAHRVETTIQVRVSDAGASGTCLVRATAADHSIVGEKTVRVSGRSGSSREVVDVRTEREATTVEVERCTGS